jgi:hypothetical protein
MHSQKSSKRKKINNYTKIIIQTILKIMNFKIFEKITFKNLSFLKDQTFFNTKNFKLSNNISKLIIQIIILKFL